MGANASAHKYPAWKSRLSVFLRSAKKSFVSLPGVVSFSAALLYCYHTGSITIGLSLYIYRFGFVFCYLNTVFPSFLCVLCVSSSVCAAGMPRGKRLLLLSLRIEKNLRSDQ